MGPKIIRKSSFKLIGFRLPPNYDKTKEQHVIKNTVSQLKAISEKIPNKVRDDVLVIQIYPMMEQFNPFHHKDSLLIGYEVENTENGPEHTELYTIEENMYVNCKHNGSRSDIYKTYDYLYNNWIQKNRCIPLGFDMEVWNEQEESNVDICVAINKPR
ncbi:GyrI-like domain-containing protein [Paucisalibacillus sp. EB02]|uniref:GyrI-like domain-containing protein n=1 Tax=Paucisalibacillus sp. EB02 TaxID=1347087 RepID=UPI0004B27A06|nr:GyrI-like domain-containing protein [Paucisalibacillus sp. EB02]